jgi:GT2 family glycosyltransferase
MTSIHNNHNFPAVATWAQFCCSLVPPRNFPKIDQDILVSIIVTAFNHWKMTTICLCSILEACDAGIPYEVILVDDDSEDETCRAEELFLGIRYIRSRQNLGYIHACNSGAAAARGKHILFLNNDTAVLPGWLESLYTLMEYDDSVAVIGSRLHHLDGRVQDAGGILWNDGSASRYGNGQPSDTPHLSYVAEVDYVTGASMLVRGSFWRETGGMDKRFGRGYCEDSDLAMRARACGFRVLYQPASRVVHWEHATFGESNQERITANRILLHEKWRKELAEQHLPPLPAQEQHIGRSHSFRRPLPEVTKRSKAERHAVLYYYPLAPDDVRVRNDILFLTDFFAMLHTMGHYVHCTCPRPASETQEVANLRAATDSFNALPAFEPPELNLKPYFDLWYREGLGEDIQALCGRYGADILICAYAFHSRALEYAPSYVFKILDTFGTTDNQPGGSTYGGYPGERFVSWHSETGRYLHRADAILVRSEAERDLCCSLWGLENSYVLGGRHSGSKMHACLEQLLSRSRAARREI